jgi:hypothetical protein
MNTIKRDMLTLGVVAALGVSSPSISLAMGFGDANRTGAAEVRILTDADMPPFESLKDGDNYSVFMSPGVSEAVRIKALRRLFRSAAFNRTDGLSNYAQDYTAFTDARARLVGLGKESTFSTM